MKDYISREKLLAFPLRRNGEHCDKEHANPHFLNGIETVMEYAETLPSEDVTPVVRGRWLPAGLFDDFAKCSVCGSMEYSLHEVYRKPHRYCFNCGAKMDLAD